MTRIAYVNGRYLLHRQAAVHIEDRGFQFADGVYEVCEVRGGRLVDETRHLERLARSLREIRIVAPIEATALRAVLREVVRRNRVVEGIVYLQVTRGVALRNHAFPMKPVRPSLVITARSFDPAQDARRAAEGIAVITTPDNRWGRVDIKTIGLLPNVLAKQAARESGAYEAWFIDSDGFVTEGSSTNAWIVTGNGVLVTRPADHGILHGITRRGVMEVARDSDLALEERAFTVAEALAAREAFITAASTIVMPVVTLDGRPIGDGKPGPLATRLRAAYHEYAEIGSPWASAQGKIRT